MKSKLVINFGKNKMYASDEKDVIDIELANLNNLPAIIIYRDSDPQLEDLGFIYHKAYMSVRLMNANKAEEIFQKIQDTFEVPQDNIDVIENVLTKFKSASIIKSKKSSDAVKFIKMIEKDKKHINPELNVYTLCNDKVSLIFTKDKNPKEAFNLFKQLKGRFYSDGFYFYMPKSGRVSEFSNIINKLNEMYDFDKYEVAKSIPLDMEETD